MINRPNFELWSENKRVFSSLGIPLFLGVIFVVAFFPAIASAQFNRHAGPSGSSSRNDRINAIRSIPFAELNDEAQRRINEVVNNPSFYRRLPTTKIDTDPEHFRFLVRNPEVIVSIWQTMGVTQLQLDRTGPYTVQTDDGAGTQSQLELIYGNNDLHVYYGKGSYAGNLIKRKLTGRFVVVVRAKSNSKKDGSFDLANRLDVFLKVDNATAAFITRTIQPIVGNTADYNFVESMKFIERLNDTARSNAPGVKSMVSRLNIAKQTQQNYSSVIDQVFERSIRSVSTEQGPVRQSRSKSPAPKLSTNEIARVAPTPQRVEVGRPSDRQATNFSSMSQLASESNLKDTLPGVSILEGGRRPSILAARSRRMAANRSTPTSVQANSVRANSVRANSVRAKFFSPRPATAKFSDASATSGADSIRRR